jgi:hypothetical protein
LSRNLLEDCMAMAFACLVFSLSPSLLFFFPFGWAVMGFKGKYLIHYWQNLPGWAHLILTTTSCMERLQVFSVIVAGVIFTRVRE